MPDGIAMTCVLRRATTGDAATLARLVVAAFAEYRGRLLPESGALSETATSIAAQLADGHGAFLVERDGDPVACVLFQPDAGDLYFGRLAVVPAHRGAGLAPLLVAAVEDEARVRGYPAVRLGVRVALPANQRLFAGLGYVEISREAHPGFVEPTSITMRKVL